MKEMRGTMMRTKMVFMKGRFFRIGPGRFF